MGTKADLFFTVLAFEEGEREGRRKEREEIRGEITWANPMMTEPAAVKAVAEYRAMLLAALDRRDNLCGFPSSVSDATCILPSGHPADSPNRFHRFRRE